MADLKKKITKKAEHSVLKNRIYIGIYLATFLLFTYAAVDQFRMGSPLKAEQVIAAILCALVALAGLHGFIQSFMKNKK